MGYIQRRRYGNLSPWERNLYVLFSASLLSVTGFSVVNPFITLFVHELHSEYGSTEFWTGMVFSAHAFVMFFTAPMWGSLADRIGRKLMIQRAMFGSALIIGLMSLVQTPLQLVILRALHGAVTGTVPASFALIGASVPEERTGYAMGLMQMGIWLGASIGPLIGGFIADTFGYRAAFYVTATLLAIAGFAVTRFVHENFHQQKRSGKMRRELVNGWLSVLHTPRLPKILTIRFLVRFGDAALVPFLPLYVASLMTLQDRVSSITGLAVGLMSAFGALSSIYLGHIADRIGYRLLLLACSFGAMCIFILISMTDEIWQLIVLFSVLGVILGGVVPSVTALLTRAAPGGHMGSVYGIDASVTAGARMVAPLLGALVVSFSGLPTVFTMIAFIFGIITIFTLWQSPMKVDYKI